MEPLAGSDRKRFRADSASIDYANHSATNGSGLAAMQGKSKPCLKFFSTCGCPYGEGCHFSHYVPGGLSALTASGVTVNVSGNFGHTAAATPSPAPGVNLGGFKSRLCKLFGTSEGCRFGDKCHFAHGDHELRKSNDSIQGNHRSFSPNGYSAAMAPESNRSTMYTPNFHLPQEPSPPGIAGSFGVSSMAKMSIDATMTGIVIGKGGVHAKEISRITGAKLAIRDHESDPNLRYVELEGTFDQINFANQMVRELLMNKDPLPPKNAGSNPHNYKTKLCQNYAQGTCTFGERCHFAHGDVELR